MNIGIVGYQSSGKSTLFEWLTEVAADPALSHTSQSAMAPVPEPRVARLCEIYDPKKITLASMQLVDTAGLDRSHEGNAQRLSQIREAGCLVHVVGAYAGGDPLADVTSLSEDLLLADMEIVARRVEKLRESTKKPRPTRDQELAELEALEPVLATLESGRPASDLDMNEEQSRAVRSFQLLTEKPRLVVFNTGDDETEPEKLTSAVPEGTRSLALPIGLAVELARMEPDERTEMIEELGIEAIDRDTLLQTILDVSGQMLFFTAGDKEVRTWMVRQGATAVEAADGIHSDLARGFVRTETMTCDDLFRLGSEREVKAAKLMRHEPKDYVIQDGDILHILSNA